MKHRLSHRALFVIGAIAMAVPCIGSVPASAQPSSTSSNTSTASAAPTQPCPALYVLGIQNSEEGSATSAGTGDSGMLGKAFGQLVAKTGGAVARSYIVFGADMDSTNYTTAVTTASDQIDQDASEVIDRCPSTLIAVAGYAQGAAAAALFAEKVGSGHSRVPSDKVAAVALLANPSRRNSTGALPGTDNASIPAAAPGILGANVSTIILSNTGLSGAGIAASTTPVSYGTLTGRVADLCVAGDATCDVQSGSPLATAVANISSQAEGKDPVGAIATVAQALASTAFTTAVGLINDDITGTSLDQLSYTPNQTLGQRIAAASSPTAPAVSESDALSALFKIGTLGFNAAITVAQNVFTATTIAELAAVGLSNPVAAVGILGAKVADSIVDLVPPQSISTWVNSAFDAITSTITDTDDLYTASATAQYSNSLGRRSSYSTVAATTTGETPLTATAAWFTAIADDLTATSTSPSSTRVTTTPTSSPPQVTPSGPAKATPTQTVAPSATTGPAATPHP